MPEITIWRSERSDLFYTSITIPNAQTISFAGNTLIESMLHAAMDERIRAIVNASWIVSALLTAKDAFVSKQYDVIEAAYIQEMGW
jgi:hypothetical protein